MTGPHIGDLASALADGQLGGAEAEAVRAHVAFCPACSAELDATVAVRSVVRRLPPMEPRRPLVAVAPLPGRFGRAAGLLGAAAASVALLVMSGVEQRTRTVPEVAQLVQVHSTAPVNLDPMSQLAPAMLPVSLER